MRWAQRFDEHQRRRGRHLWAKSDRDGAGHSLLAHMLDTGLIAARLIRSRPSELKDVAEALGVDQALTAGWLAALAALHDLGKATPVFQAQWPEGAPQVARERTYAPMPHGRATTVLLAPMLQELGFSRRAAVPLAHAVGAHNGWVDTASQIGPSAYDPHALGEGSPLWEVWRNALADNVRDAFGAHTAPTLRQMPRVRTWTRIAGLTAVSDWLASCLPRRGPVDDVTTYLAARQLDVDARLVEVGWPPVGTWWREPAGAGFAAWFSSAMRFESQALGRLTRRAWGRPAPVLAVDFS